MQFAIDIFWLYGFWAVGTIIWLSLLIWIWNDADEHFAWSWLWVLGMVFMPIATLVTYLIVRAIVCRQVPDSQRRPTETINPQGWGSSLPQNPDRDLAGTTEFYEGNDNYTLNSPRPVDGFKPFTGSFSEKIETWRDNRRQPEKEEPNDWLH